ncbi:MAG: aminoacyl-tRNA hydrolase [Pseudomonadota bacterium]
MKLVVGLGNPGKKYAGTRHNAGFWFVERLAAATGARFSADRKFHGDVAKLATDGGEIWLLQPATFMNGSGQAVGALAGFYKIAASDILVAHDELDLAPGVARLKFGGGVSGHNGLRDIRAQLGTADFWRLRIGIGHPRESTATEQEVVDYVLHAPRTEERSAMVDAITRSLEVWPLLAADKQEAAMLRLHTKTQASGEQ